MLFRSALADAEANIDEQESDTEHTVYRFGDPESEKVMQKIKKNLSKELPKPEALTRNEAALLAAVLPSPRRLSAANPSPYVLRRAAWIQRQMHQLGPEYVEWP